MAVSDADIAFACDLLADLGSVRVRKMFGGAGVYADDMMFAILADGAIFVKTDDALAAELAALGCGPFTYVDKAGVTHEMGYGRLPESANEDPEEACRWARRALAVAAARKKTR